MAIRHKAGLEKHDSLDSLMPRAPKHCTKYDVCGNKALPGKRNCAQCGDSRWPTDDPTRHERMHEIPEATYSRIFKRDNHLCQIGYVGICTSDAEALDHIKPHYQGGTDEDDNLQGACNPCHGAKSSDEGHLAQGHKVRVRQRLSDIDMPDTGGV